MGHHVGKVAVIGANGRIGPALTRYLSETEGLEVVAVSRNSLGRNSLGSTLLRHVDCEKRIGSIADPILAQKLIGDCEIVVNCAFDRGLPRTSKIINQKIIYNIAKIEKITQVILLSTVALYGTLVHNGNMNFHSPRPDTPYGKLKRTLEKYAIKMLSQTNQNVYVLRTGHVYGPFQWLSKYIFETVKSESFTLPFNGRLPSNAIHIDNLSSGIRGLIFNSTESGIYNFTDYPQRSWREIYDWHTKLLNEPPVPGMDDDKSELQFKKHLEIYKRSMYARAVLDIVSWLKSIPFHNLEQLQSLRALMFLILSYSPLVLERGMKLIYDRWSAKKKVLKFSEQMFTPDPLLFCLEVPGPYLAIRKSSDLISYDSDQELKSWLRELG
jgi:nucleoside-diphosphate-sugar epimerase